MRAVGCSNVMKESGHRRDEEASFETPCKNIKGAGDESSGTNKAPSEATDAACDV